MLCSILAGGEAVVWSYKKKKKTIRTVCCTSPLLNHLGIDCLLSPIIQGPFRPPSTVSMVKPAS